MQPQQTLMCSREWQIAVADDSWQAPRPGQQARAASGVKMKSGVRTEPVNCSWNDKVLRFNSKMSPQSILMSSRERHIAGADDSLHVPRAGQQTNASEGIWPKPLRRLAAVVFQQPAQPLLTANVAERSERQCNWILFSVLALPFSRFRQQLVLQPLVRPFSQIVGQVHGSDAGEMLKSEEDEMVQALPANRSDESFDECLAVRRIDGTPAGWHVENVPCPCWACRSRYAPSINHEPQACFDKTWPCRQPLPLAKFSRPTAWSHVLDTKPLRGIMPARVAAPASVFDNSISRVPAAARLTAVLLAGSAAACQGRPGKADLQVV